MFYWFADRFSGDNMFPQLDLAVVPNQGAAKSSTQAASETFRSIMGYKFNVKSNRKLDGIVAGVSS